MRMYKHGAVAVGRQRGEWDHEGRGFVNFSVCADWAQATGCLGLLDLTSEGVVRTALADRLVERDAPVQHEAQRAGTTGTGAGTGPVPRKASRTRACRGVADLGSRATGRESLSDGRCLVLTRRPEISGL